MNQIMMMSHLVIMIYLKIKIDLLFLIKYIKNSVHIYTYTYTYTMYENDNLNQEYINLSCSKKLRDEIEDDISNRLTDNTLVLNDDEYNYLNFKLYKLYCKINEIRNYLYNVSPIYRDIFQENHVLDSVICIF